MRVEDVVDRESLEAYLNGLPDETTMATAQFVAFQSGARVAPIALRFFAENPDTDVHAARVLPIWASLVIQKIALHASTCNLSEIAIAHAAHAIDFHADYAGEHANDIVADATLAVSNGSFSSVAIAEAADYYKSTVISSVTHGVHCAAIAFVQIAPKAKVDFWSFVRDDLQWGQPVQDQPLWLKAEMPDVILSEWQATCAAFEADKSGIDWTFWRTWYERILAGNDIYADRLAPIVNQITQENWVVYPARVNALFDDVLAVYRAEDARADGVPAPQDKTWREVVKLKDFLDVEYADLMGRHQRSAVEKEVLDALENLKVFVDFMVGRVENASSDSERAAILEHQIWPPVVAEVNKLARVEPDPRLSSTILSMPGPSAFVAKNTAGLERTKMSVADRATIQKSALGWRRIFPFNLQRGD